MPRIAILLLLIPCAASSLSDAVADDQDRLCGTWVVDPAAGGLVGTEFAFFSLLGGLSVEWTAPGPGVPADFQATIGPGATPPTIDLVNAASGTKQLGVYRLNGNQLQLRIASATDSRPNDFAAPLRAGEVNLTLIRRLVPDGWTHISLGKGTGVDVYEKTYPAGTSTIHHFVTVANLNKASLRNAVGATVKRLEAPIQSHYTTQYWNNGLTLNTPTRKLKVLLNGSYFSGPNLGPSSMDHGLKKDGTLWGYGTKNAAIAARIPHLRAFSFGDGWARVGPHNRPTFNDVSIPNVVGGIGTGWPVNAKVIQGRNLVGVRDADEDAEHETVVFFVTNRARQRDAVLALSRFGVSERHMMMLDGGNSSRLIVDGDYKVKAQNPLAQPARRFPHMISIYMGK